MSKIEILPASRRDVRWAIGRDFVFLEKVDPAFDPKVLGKVRHYLIKNIFLPNRYNKVYDGFILKLDGGYAGYVFANTHIESTHIETLGVEPEFRCQKYATRLVERVTELAHKYEHQFLSAAVTDQNESARAFLRALDFQPYRAEGWCQAGDEPFDTNEFVEKFEVEDSPAHLRALGPSPTEGTPFYEHWLEHELEHGDAWVKEVIWEDYKDLALRTPAQDWVCLLDEEELGYIRLAGTRETLWAYLSCHHDYWDSDVQVQWLAQALRQYPFRPGEFTLKVGSGGHHEASRAVWEKVGFQAYTWPRYILFKRLAAVE
jgi:GNAT superfamily N-acetyltransferase